MFFDIIVIVEECDDMNRRGQALVEFILVIPILVFFIMCMVDFFFFFIKKHALEGDLDYVIELYKDNKQELIEQYKTKENIDVSIKSVEGYATIVVSRSVKINTPFITIAIENPFVIKTSRVIKDE